MKILSLRLQNIHSLYGEHFFSFDSGPLAEAGLFVITGPTGSGKSTILDAITLALYNRIPRTTEAISNANILEKGLVMTRHTRNALSEVVFESGGVSYRAHWSIEVNRKGNLNMRKHEISCVEDGRIINEKLSEVVQAIQKIVGLSYDQFVQSILLAQGQFSKLLNAERKERNKLLEEITGAQIYRKIGMAAYSKFSLIKREEEDLLIRMQEVQLLPDEERQNKENRDQWLEPETRRIAAEQKQREEAIALKRNIRKKKAEHEELCEKLTEKQNEKNNKALDWKRLEAHELRVPLQHLLVGLENTQANLKRRIEEREEVNREILFQKELADAAKQQVWDLIQQSPANTDPKTALLAFQESTQFEIDAENRALNNVQNQKQQLLERSQEIAKRIPAFSHNETANQVAEKTLSEIKSEMATHGWANLEALKQARASLEKQKIQLSERIVNAERYEQQQKQYEAKEQQRKEWQQELAEKRAISQKMQSEIIEMGPKLLEAEKRQGQSAFAEHRSRLEEGKPCPLCGATHHPFTGNNPPENDSAFLEELRQAIHSATLNREKAEAQAELIQRNVNEMNKEMEELLKNMAISVEKLNALMPELEKQKAADLRKQAEQNQANLNIALNCEQKAEITQNLEEYLHRFHEYQKAREAYEQQKNKRKSVYSGNNLEHDVRNLLLALGNPLIIIQEKHKQAETLNSEIKEATRRQEEQENSLQKEMIARKIPSAEDLREGILSPSVADTLSREKEALRAALETLNVRTETTAREYAEMQAKDNPALTLEDLELQHQNAEEELNEKVLERGALRKELEADQQKRNHLSTLQKQKEILNRERIIWEKMNALIGDAQGARFANFVQEITLEQLLYFANQRLKSGLSARYTFSMPGLGDKHLKVCDKDLGSSLRDVLTLSGGETFKLSLAMAFGLSDLTARNVSIDTLFIDEGFGNLDPESLNDAVSVLENMQNKSNKVMGIISHVGELKERIGTRIKLSPQGNGFSTSEVWVEGN
jgi:exonuclease SbcC